jgi:type IV pilus assembly protein PilZ
MTDPNATDASKTDEERRAALRHPISLRVEYKRVNNFFADYTRNISRGGTFIATPRPLPIGTEFVFELVIPSLAEPLRLSGVVTWRIEPHEATEDKPAGMGIRFRYQTDQERQDVHNTVEALAVEKLGPVVGRGILEKPP